MSAPWLDWTPRAPVDVLEVGAKQLRRCAPPQLARAKELYAARQNSIAEIMALTGFKSRATFYKYVVNAQRQV